MKDKHQMIRRKFIMAKELEHDKITS